jgi:hypothetical protein
VRYHRGCPEPVGDGQPRSSKISPGFPGLFVGVSAPRDGLRLPTGYTVQ